MSAYFHADKGWYYRFYSKTILYERRQFSTKRAALDAEAAKRRELGAPRSPDDHISASDAARLYLRDIHGTLAASTHQHATRALDRFVAHVGAGHLVSMLTSEHVEAYKHARLRQPGKRGPLTGATVNRDLIYLSAWFNWCRRRPRRWLTDNPAGRLEVKRYAEPWPDRDLLSDVEREDMWKRLELGAGRPVRIHAELLYHLGVRRGVVLGLTWPQVDWDHALIAYTSKGKSRVLPMNSRAMTLLREVHEGAAAPSMGRVFPGSDARLRRWWSRVRIEMGHPHTRFHDQRVSFARDLASQGTDLVTVRELMGHSSLAMVERYVPAYLAQARTAVERLTRKS